MCIFPTRNSCFRLASFESVLIKFNTRCTAIIGMGNSENGAPKGYLTIQTQTWQKESHQLFDYDAEEYLETSITNIARDGYLLRDDSDEFHTCFSHQPKPHQQILLALSQISSSVFRIQEQATLPKPSGINIQSSYSYHIADRVTSRHDIPMQQADPIPSIMQGQEQSSMPFTKESLWMVAQIGNYFSLHAQDQLRLGRVSLVVREINLSPDVSAASTTRAYISEPVPDFEDRDKSVCSAVSAQLQCRICFGKDYSDSNPLVSPCKCSGSLQNIHLGCLRDWLQTKVNKRETKDCVYYSWKKLICEICKEGLDSELRSSEFPGVSFNLLEFERPNEPYIMLESVKTRGSEEKVSLFICKLRQNAQIRIGRDQQCELKISDISVSRNHCVLIMKRGQVLIQDRKSKFGTLLKFRNSFRVGGQEIWMQFGRTLIKIRKQQDSMGALCCKCSGDTQYEIVGSLQSQQM